MLVHAHIFDPRERNLLFKVKANDRASCTTVECSNSENCALFKLGTCATRSIFYHPCPYGRQMREEGPTKRARGCGDWVAKRREATKGVPHLDPAKVKLAEVGDYIYMSYPYQEEVRGKGDWIPKDQFTVEMVVKLCEHRPRDWYGREMPSYQRDEVPKFVAALATTFPDMFQKVCEVYPRAKALRGDEPNVGRKAVLGTLNPNVGTFKDIHGGVWVWDGEYLTSTNSHISFALVRTFSEVRIKPDPKSEVTITDEAQVNENTEFVS